MSVMYVGERPLQFIVAEISKNWTTEAHQSDPGFLNKLFEDVIETNRQRGYRLYQFQLNRVMTSREVMNETIIAVFERTEDLYSELREFVAKGDKR
jgi:hypothetical protein